MNVLPPDQPTSAPHQPGALAAWLPAAAAAVMGAVIFGFYPSYPTLGALDSLATWMWHACNAKNDFLHGRAVPAIFAVMCWFSWRQARGEERRPSNWGIPLIGLGLALYLLSIRTIQPRLAVIGLPFLILGVVVFVWGFRVGRHFLFPAFMWYFAMPIPGFVQATNVLQLVVTKVCFKCGLLMGMPLANDGNTISCVGSNAWDVNIAEGCSGIRSLLALAMISAIYANYTQKVLWKKVFLFCCSLPLAMLGNFGRIFTILLLSHWGFKEFAVKTYHDWAGMLIFFPISLSGLYAIDALINLRSRVKRRMVRKTVRNAAENVP